jgi:hypothetical protein
MLEFSVVTVILAVTVVAISRLRRSDDGGPDEELVDLPCPWCGSQTGESDSACPSCHHRFGENPLLAYRRVN